MIMISPPMKIILLRPTFSPTKKVNKAPNAQPMSYNEVMTPCSVIEGELKSWPNRLVAPLRHVTTCPRHRILARRQVVRRPHMGPDMTPWSYPRRKKPIQQHPDPPYQLLVAKSSENPTCVWNHLRFLPRSSCILGQFSCQSAQNNGKPSV